MVKRVDDGNRHHGGTVKIWSRVLENVDVFEDDLDR